MIRRAGWLGVAALSLSVAACELIVPGTLSEVSCADEGAVGPPACLAGELCAGGKCRPGPPEIGAPCSAGDLCAPGDRCTDPATYGLPGQAFCSRPCCSSADCGDDTGAICAILGPGKLCVPAVTWGRGDVGERFAGEPCASDAECRSGACADKGGYCEDACCIDAECAAFGATCRSGAGGWRCEPDPGPRKGGLAPCVEHADCASGLCTKWPDGALRCADPCCSSAECGKVDLGGELHSVLCVPMRREQAVVLACAAVIPGDADRAVGAPCDKDEQCRGGRCVDAERGDPTAGKVCTDVCCTDASCGAPHLFACAAMDGGADPGTMPGSEGQGFDLQCVKR